MSGRYSDLSNILIMDIVSLWSAVPRCDYSVSQDGMAAAGAMLTAIFSHAADRSGLRADWEGKTRFR
jgi:hypothetical protein